MALAYAMIQPLPSVACKDMQRFSTKPVDTMTLSLFEIIGYIASILVVISILMRSIVRLRVINLVGAAVFTVYGLLIQAYPVAVLNFLIVLIDLYYLRQMFATKPYFSLLDISKDSDYLTRFLSFHATEIKQFFPSFKYTASPTLLLILTLRDMIPVGLLIAEREGAGRLFVTLDYVIPGYRDLSPARYLYETSAARFRELGISMIYSVVGNESHRRYLQRIGFSSATLPDHGEVLARTVSQA